MKKLLMALVLLPLMALADTETVDGITWTYSICDGMSKIGPTNVNDEPIIGYDDWARAISAETAGMITIPSVLGGCPVTSIGDSALNGCCRIESVIIPSSVKRIGERAFYGCSGLNSVTIPPGVEDIGSEAFQGCRGLADDGGLVIVRGVLYDCFVTGSSAEIPLGVTRIGDFAFYGCSELTSVTIPSSVTSIGEGAFSCCSGLTSVVIPSSVTSIGGSAFCDCSGIRSLTILSSLPNVGVEAFHGCRGLADENGFVIVRGVLYDYFGTVTAVEIPSIVTCIGESAFECRSELMSVAISSSVTNIGAWAFTECSGLTSVTIPFGVTSIGQGAFSWCDGLKSVTIPPTVTSIGEWAFIDCYRIGTIIVGIGDSSRVSGLLEGGDFYASAEMFVEQKLEGGSSAENERYATVTLDALGGSVPSGTMVVQIGTAIGSLPTATRSGYTFDGWYTAASGGTKVTAAATVTGNMTLYAHWAKSAVNYTVTFNANGGSCSTSSKSYVGGSTLGMLPTATRSGYTFDGWYTAASGGTKVLASTTVTGSMTLYAHWKIVVDKDKVQNEWYASYSDHAVPSWVMVGGDQVYVDEVSFPYVFPSSGAVLNRTQGGYRVDLKGVLLKPGPWTSNVIDADGDLSIYLENENVIEGRVQLSGRGGVLDPLPSSHRLLIYGPGKLTILGESDGMNSAIGAVDSVSIMAGATVSIYGERTGIGTGDILISGSMVGVYGSSYRAIECNNLRILAGVFSMQTTHQGIYAKGDVVIDASIVNAFTPQICVYSGNFYASNSYLALAATSLDDSLSSHSVLLSTEVSFNQCVAKIIGFASIYECDSWMTRITDACGINANQVAFGDGDYYIGLKAKGFVGSEDNQYTTSGILADSFLMMGGNVRVCSPGISAISVARPIFMAGEMDVMSGMLEIQDKFDTTEMFKFDAGIVAGYTATIGAGIFDASTASVDFYTQVFLDALSNGLLENIEGKASSSITFGNGFYVQMGGTVLAKGSAHGILTYKYPAIINGGSCRAEFQLYEAGGHYYETSPVFVEGETVNQNLKCVEYAVSGASKYDKIARSWDGVLPSYYGTQSLYADEGGKLYFWVPESWVVTSVFTITFDAQGGDVVENARTAKSGNAIGGLPTPTRSKYKFLGWYTSTEGGTKISSATKVTADVTYYAHWQYDGQSRVDVKVTAGCANMGTVSGGKSAKGGTKLTLKATAKKGYVFAGWYRDAAGEKPVEGVADYRSPSYTYVVGEDDATFFAKFIPVDEDWVGVWCQPQDEYVRGGEIAPLAVVVDSASLATVKVTGLPTGLKFTAKAMTLKATNNRAAVDLPANTIYGTPTKSGIYTATITVTTAGKKSETYKVDFVVRGDGEYLVDVMGIDGADYPDNGSDTQHAIQWGKMSGYGVFKPNKTATLKATANKGYVFAGWFSEVACVCEGGAEDDGCIYTPAEGSVDYRSTSFPVKVGYEDVLYYARFVRAEDDDKLWANVEDAYYLNGAWSLKLDIESMSLPTVTVKGLPSGLKFNSKTLTISGTPTKPGTYSITLSLKNKTIKKAKTQSFVLYVANIESPYLKGINYANDAYVYRVGTSMEFDIGSCATDGYSVTGVNGLPSGLKFDKKTGFITGVPTKAGPKTVTITLKNGKLTSSATITFNVDAIDTWAYGTFNGGGEAGVLTLTVGNTGKISGKWMTVDGTWTLSAKSYESYDEDEQGCYRSLVAAKCGAQTAHFWLDAYDGRVDIYEYLPTLCGYGPLVATAKRNAWKEVPWKALAAQMKGGRLALTDEVSLKIGTAGAVTATGRFVTGQNARGEDIVYSVSCSTVLVPVEEDVFKLYLCFPKKDGKFDGMALQEVLEWSGRELAIGCAACREGF